MKKLDLSPRPILDLNYIAFETRVHDIRVIGTWYRDPEENRVEPALVLLHAGRPISRGQTIPCVIPLSRSWLWTREFGDARHCARIVYGWLKNGALPGEAADKASHFRVLDAVQARLRDLIAMPPAPDSFKVRHNAIAVGEMDLIDQQSGKILAQNEVTYG